MSGAASAADSAVVPEEFDAHFRGLQRAAQASAFGKPAEPAPVSVANVEAGKPALWRGKMVHVHSVEDVATPSGGTVRIACVRFDGRVKHVFAGELKA